MEIILEAAKKLAMQQTIVITRLDIYYDYKAQAHHGRVWYADGNGYDIMSDGTMIAL